MTNCYLSSISDHFRDTALQSRKPPHRSLSLPDQWIPSKFRHQKRTKQKVEGLILESVVLPQTMNE